VGRWAGTNTVERSRPEVAQGGVVGGARGRRAQGGAAGGGSGAPGLGGDGVEVA
jgi:hypothetical protein